MKKQTNELLWKCEGETKKILWTPNHPFMIYVSFVQDPQKEKGLKFWKLLGWLCEHFLKNDKKIESDFHADFFFLHVKHFHVWFSWCENFFFPYYTPLFAAETKMKSDKNYKKKQKTLAKHYALIV